MRMLYQFRVICCICGGEGVGTGETAAASWFVGSQITHTDPRACAEFLKEQRKELDKERERLAAQSA